jgi:hypothetical protein
MEKQLLLLAAEMLDLASGVFSFHGADDLSKEALALITDEEGLCNEFGKWNGVNDWPETASQINDSGLMRFLGSKIKEAAAVEDDPRFTVDEIRNYIITRDSLGDVMYYLKAENIEDANNQR